MLFVTFMNQKIIMVGIVKAQEGMKRQHFRESVWGTEETALNFGEVIWGFTLVL